jgi:hypothetical protein
MGATMAGLLGQAFQPNQPTAPAQPAPAPTPATPAPAGVPGGTISREQVQQAIDNLDLRFSMGEISETAYNRLMQKWQDRLKEMGG